VSAGRRERGARPLLPVERRGHLRIVLLERYDADAEIRDTLEDLAGLQPADRFSAEYDAFDAELVALAERIGLDRLRGDDGVNVSGVDLLRRWALLRLGPGDLARAGTFGFYPPDLTEEEPPRYDPPASRVAWEARSREYADRRDRAAEAAGYVFPDTAPGLQDQVRWLFLHLRYGWKWPAIAKAEAARPDSDPDKPKSDAAIRQAVGRLAKDIGADV
jgi:hypothetical protein